MFLYISILVFIFIGLIYEQNTCPPYSPKTRGAAAFLLVLAIGFVVGLRDMMGGYDVYVYANIFESLARKQEFSLGMFFNLGSQEETAMGQEPGWLLYNKIVGIFTANSNTFFFVTAMLSYVFLFRHLRKFAPYFFFALLIIFCRQFLQSFIYVRQFFACMTVWFALDFAIKRKLIPFLLVVFVAMNIHISGLIFIIVYPLARWKMPLVIMLGGFAAALVMGLTPGFGALLESFGEAAGNEKAMGYSEGTGGGVHLFYMIEGVLMAAALLMARSSVYGTQPKSVPAGRFGQLAQYIPRADVESNARTLCLFNVSFLYICASLTTLQSPGMMRLIWVYWIGPICMLPYICERMVAGSGKNVFKFLVVLYFLTAFWLFAIRFDAGALLDYKTFLF